jgi:hypothetical protein
MKLHNCREKENRQEIKVQRREVKEGLTEHGSNPYSGTHNLLIHASPLAATNHDASVK